MAWPKGVPRKKPEPVVTDAVKVLDRLSSLKLEAETIADMQDHAVEWSDHPGWSEGWCYLCKAKVAVAPHPPPGSLPLQVSQEMMGPCR